MFFKTSSGRSSQGTTSASKSTLATFRDEDDNEDEPKVRKVLHQEDQATGQSIIEEGTFSDFEIVSDYSIDPASFTSYVASFPNFSAHCSSASCPSIFRVT